MDVRLLTCILYTHIVNRARWAAPSCARPTGAGGAASTRTARGPRRAAPTSVSATAAGGSARWRAARRCVFKCVYVCVCVLVSSGREKGRKGSVALFLSDASKRNIRLSRSLAPDRDDSKGTAPRLGLTVHNFNKPKQVARGRTSFCAAHGGGVRCKVEGCNKAAVRWVDWMCVHTRHACKSVVQLRPFPCMHADHFTPPPPLNVHIH